MSPTPTIFLHIGTMKSGTSYLQRVLSRNHEVLAELGVLSMSKATRMGRVATDALAREETADHVVGAWSDAAALMLEWPERAVVLSNEILSFAQRDQVQVLVQSLQPAEVVVIITARDLARQLPSAWQNKIKHGRGWEFSSFVNSVMRETREDGAGRSFWHHHDLPEIASRWSDAAGKENVVIIPVPPSGSSPEVLWQRFASVLDVPADRFDTAQDQRSNLSMGYVETEMLRKVNLIIRAAPDKDVPKSYLLGYLANEILRPDPTKSAAATRAIVPPEAHDWSIERSKQMVEDVRALGVRVVGDLDELVPRPRTTEERELAATAEAPVVPDEVAEVVSKLIARIVELERPPAEPSDRPKSSRMQHRIKRKERRKAKQSAGDDTDTEGTVGTDGPT